jgi:hypothetical protein
LIVAHDGDDALEKAVDEIAFNLSLEHGVLLCQHVISTWRFAQMRARQEFIYKNVVGEGIDLWPLVIRVPKIAEEPAPYNTGSEEENEDYGIYIYLNHRLLCCPDDAVRVAFEIRALRQYAATRPLRRIRWRYVMRRITQGWYGRLKSEAQTMVDVEVIQQRLGALEEFVSRLEEMRSRSLEEWQEDVVARYATERELEVAIQRVLNIATHVLTHLLLSCDLKGGNDLLAYYKFPGATTLLGQRRELDHQISNPSIVTVRPDEHISLR